MPDGIYTIGGFDGVDQKYCADVHKYDINSNTWTSVASMNIKRGAFSAIALPTCDYVYAIGGFGQNGSPI